MGGGGPERAAGAGHCFPLPDSLEYKNCLQEFAKTRTLICFSVHAFFTLFFFLPEFDYPLFIMAEKCVLFFLICFLRKMVAATVH